MGVLVLNATYEPLSVVPRRRAITLMLAGKARMIAVDASGDVLRSASGDVYEVPSVVALTRYVRIPYRRVPLTRRTLAARDKYVCQVVHCAAAGTTIDHVIPRSRGGGHTWDNLVLMCSFHNHKKGNKFLKDVGWKLKQVPCEPQATLLMTNRPEPQWDEWLNPATASA